MERTTRLSLLFAALLALPPAFLQAQSEEYVEEVTMITESIYFLPVVGKVTDGERKISDCEVVVFQGNDVIVNDRTDRSGRFEVELDLGPEYTIEFRRDGFLPKRVVVDTRTDIPLEKLVYGPLALDVSLLSSEKYTGVDTDVLDFPFAIVRYDKRQQTYAADVDYTMGMQRTNGALLLMAGRVGQ